jgi:cytochrome c oxidase subunit I+III
MQSQTPVPKDLSPIALHKALDRVWTPGKGWERLSAVNHTVIGKRFMVTALLFFAIGGFLGMLIRTQLATAENAFMDAEQYAQIFTMHGTIMMFLFAIPFFEGLAIYLLPKMLGARDLAFPRLSAYGYWCYLFGGSMLIVALLLGIAPSSGWFMYTPLSSSTYSPEINSDFWLLGITFVEISAISAAVEFVVTILRLRAPGMSLVRMPIFAWYMLIVAAMMIVGFPPMILGSILLELERAFDLPFFDPTRGGDPLLWQHLFWLFGHPEVYIIFLPAAGALSTIIPVLSRTRLSGYNVIVASLILMAFLSFGLWVHHMFTVGIPHVALSFFSAASALVTIPTAIQIFSWIGTMAKGKPQSSVPMLYVIGFFVIFILGGLTGVMLAMVPFNQQVHDTHFVVAHLHYVLVGGFLFPMLAAAYYWVPHISGRIPVQHLSKAAFWMVFIGFNLTFFIMHLTGLLGMPRRIAFYPEASPWEWLNLVSSIGSFIMSMGLMLVALDLILIFRFGKIFRRNPWNAGTLEWAIPTPPTYYAFASIPHIHQRADGLDVDRLGPELAGGKGYLAHIRNEMMETVAVDAVTGAPNQIIVFPKNSYWPLISALLTGAFFLCFLIKIYILAPLFFIATIVSFFFWAKNPDAKRDRGEVSAGNNLYIPLHYEHADAPSIFAVRVALMSNATLFACLLFGGLFLWISNSGEAMAWQSQISFTNLLFLTVSVLGTLAGIVATLGNSGRLFLQAASALIYLTAIVIGLAAVIPEFQNVTHVFDSIAFTLKSYLILHLVIAFTLSLFCILRYLTGYISPARRNDLKIARSWHLYCLWVLLISAFYLPVLQLIVQRN